MMISKKTQEFIENLAEKTERELVKWELAGRDEFKFSTKKNTVYISQASDILNDIRVTTLTVYDDSGLIVDHINYNVDIENPKDSSIEYLFNQARRTAYDANTVLNSIIYDIEHPDQDDDT